MTSRMRLLLAAPVLAGLMAAPLAAAHADWHRGGYGGQRYYGGGERYYGHRGPGVGGIVAGTLLGLGAAAVIGGALLPPPYYAPPPVVYAPPPGYYAPPPGYYPPPAYYAPPVYDGQPPG